MYAYISTPTDNRVIRIADGDVPKPILTGIPKGASGNTGALIFTSPDHAGGTDRRRGQPGGGQTTRLAGRQVFASSSPRRWTRRRSRPR